VALSCLMMVAFCISMWVGPVSTHLYGCAWLKASRITGDMLMACGGPFKQCCAVGTILELQLPCKAGPGKPQLVTLSYNCCKAPVYR
jgi:hypothetical protein